MKTSRKLVSNLILVLLFTSTIVILSSCETEPRIIIVNGSTGELENVVYSVNGDGISRSIGNIAGYTTKSIQVYAFDETAIHLAFSANGQYYYTDSGYFRPSLDADITFTVTPDLTIAVESPPDMPR